MKNLSKVRKENVKFYLFVAIVIVLIVIMHLLTPTQYR